MVKASELGAGIALPQLLTCISKLGTKEDEVHFEQYGPITCPESKHVQRNLDFRVTQISDCVIVSSEISPAGVINLVAHCWRAVIELLTLGIMCRGYITKGMIFHKDWQVIGTGYQRAYDSESRVSAFKTEADERGTPFVEVDPIVSKFIEQETDSCVREMFSRMTKTEQGATALFPFKRISHSFVLDGFSRGLDAEKEKAANDNVRKRLCFLKENVLKYVDRENVRAVSKAMHYTHALDEQLAVCDKTDEMIDLLRTPFLPRRMGK